MKILKNYEKKIIEYVEFFIVYLLMFGIMLNKHYSVDAYCYSNHSTTQYVGNLELGRIGNYFVFGLFKNINIITYQRYFTFLLIIVLTISARILYDHFRKEIEKEKYMLLLKIGILIMYGNVFMVDFFNYIEMFFAWCCGIVFMTLAVLQIRKQMSVMNMVLMLLFAIVSLNFYQALLGFFVYFGLINIYIINKGRLTVKAFWDSIKVCVCGGLSGIVNILILRILQEIKIISATDRTKNMDVAGLVTNVRNIFKESLDILIDKKGFLPSYLLVAVGLVLYAVVLYILIRKRAHWQEYVYIVLLIISCRIVLYIPHIFASTVWMAPRSVISYWSILSMPCMIIITIVDNEKLNKFASVVAMFIFIVNVVNIQKICLNIISTNRIDEEIAYLIQGEIEYYEEESGQKVEKIIFRNDAIPTWTYRTTEFQAYELCERIYVVPWGCVECINFYNDENYMYESMDDETYSRYYVKDNWDKLNLKEQLVFDGNVMYYVVY